MPPVNGFNFQECIKMNSRKICEILKAIMNNSYKPALKHHIPATRFGRHRREIGPETIAYIAVAVVTVSCLVYTYNYYKSKYQAVNITEDFGRNAEASETLQVDNGSQTNIITSPTVNPSVSIELESLLNEDQEKYNLPPTV